MRQEAHEILYNPRLNKGTAFTEAERELLGLTGLFPDAVESAALQQQRALVQLSMRANDLERYIFLSELQDRNERLFYQLLRADPARHMPIVYTPTVGEACQKFGHIMRRPKGLYVSLRHRGRVADILRNWPEADVRIICVTDGERILGLGDLGICGMGIPVGKLALYTAVGGVHPGRCMPVVLDVGTNNEAFLKDPLYPGLRQPRARGAEFDALVEEFVQAVQEVYPKCCIQFEDFHNTTAIPLLARYRDRVCCFNDDIQGTASIAVAGLFAACRALGTTLEEHRYLFFGAGSAATGIADLVVQAMKARGVGDAEAHARIWLMNSKGLVVRDNPGIQPHQVQFVREGRLEPTLLDAVRAVKPTVLIGTSTQPGTFTREVIEEMRSYCRRPVIFPYSNPTSKAECTAEQAWTWTDGDAIFAAGSPFAPVTLNGRVLVPGQGNNVYIYPAVGLAVLATEAARVTDEMFLKAAESLAARTSEAELSVGLIYPPIDRIHQSAVEVAIDVATLIFDRGLARVERPRDIHTWIRSKVYEPGY
ncbi:MAG: NAD-dependent malic enzyme [Phycisphaerales bacterium]|jgi:malate dehydrogenase (oxaloacetate-decarboxylating)(NADP+)